MKILAIETSCDETAVAILECRGTEDSSSCTVLGNTLLSQIDIHKEFGGVYPALAKRAHARNLVPVLSASLEEAGLLKNSLQEVPEEALKIILEREPELYTALVAFLKETECPAIDAIAVTHGPGLAPALWVGVNFARALSRAWGIPMIPINHMEGHIMSALGTIKDKGITITDVRFPVLALLISGGHTELVLMRSWGSYELLGATRDDAVGEAFDKVARMLGLPYPGGPEVSKLAERDREDERTNPFSLPRPMLDSGDLDFSFSGLKTSVLYTLKEKGSLEETEKEQLAREFEDAVAEVLFAKTSQALSLSSARTLVLGGGVSANIHIQRTFSQQMKVAHPDVDLRIPAFELTTDNALMIGLAGFYRAQQGDYREDIVADGNLRLAT